MKNRLKLLLLAAGTVCSMSASAIPTLYLSDGADTIIFDGSTVSSVGSIFGSGFASGGTVSWSGTVGGWSFTVTTGMTIAGGVNPSIDLDLSSAIPTVAGTLTVMYSDNNFGPSSGSVSLITGGGAIHGASLTTTAYLGNNTLFDTSGGVLVDGSILNSANLYSLTIADVLTSGTLGTANVSSADTSLTVPDGGFTVATLGFALVGVEGLRRKLRA